jgi:hypothetical protein
MVVFYLSSWETIPPSEFYKRISSPPSLQVDEILDDKKVGRRTEFLARFISRPEPVWTSQAKLKTEQNKTAIRLYQNKRSIEMEHERKVEIQRHPDIEMERYRTFEPQSELITRTAAPRSNIRPPLKEKLAATLPARKGRPITPDQTRLEIIKMKANDSNATEIRKKLIFPLRRFEVSSVE